MSASRDGYASEWSVSEDVSNACAGLARAMENLTPAFDDLGVGLVGQTQRRFETETDPHGRPWIHLSETTRRLRYVRALGNKKAVTKKGKQTQAFTKAVLAAAGRILNDEGTLKFGINHRAFADAVEVGTDMVYGRIQHLGGTSRGFIKGATIPARPFLPDFTGPDLELTIATLSTYLSRAAGGQ